MRIVITGAGGLLGWHAAVRLHARNAIAGQRAEPEPFALVLVSRTDFAPLATLATALRGADVVLHFAGCNRLPDPDAEHDNPGIAQSLVRACRQAGVAPHIVYADSIHSESDTPYGRSKRRAREILESFAPRFTNLVLPNIFGEGARPYYNNVTATFVDQVIRGVPPSVNPDGVVQLTHAGDAVQLAIDAGVNGMTGTLRPESTVVSVPDLLSRVRRIHETYAADEFPQLSDPFELALFNAYRAALYPQGFPRILPIKSDRRGALFEGAKGGGGGQTFLSWTEPGMTRGNHFHLRKVERFLVLQGEATIRIRRVLGKTTWTYTVNGKKPAAVDMPTMHTHSIENSGNAPLLTLFWAHERFDPADSDTYADTVLGA